MSTPIITVRFEEPAHEPPRRPESRQAFADALRARPGQWALLGRYSTPGVGGQEAYAIRKAIGPRNQPFTPAGSFETVARDLFGEIRVYVRYVGEAGESTC